LKVSSIVTDPPGITTGDFFAYTGIYEVADSLKPGNGYWVKASQAGKLFLNGSSQSPSASRIRIVPDAELPPAPPEGMPDGVFSGIHDGLPTDFRVESNFPNPFNPTTRIRYELPVDARVVVKVYTVLGEVVATLVDEDQKAGIKTVEWDASQFASGVYYC